MPGPKNKIVSKISPVIKDSILEGTQEENFVPTLGSLNPTDPQSFKNLQEDQFLETNFPAPWSPKERFKQSVNFERNLEEAERRKKRTFKITDPRKIRATTGQPMRPESDFYTDFYNPQIITNIIAQAKTHGQDPWTALAIGLGETNLGNKDQYNLGHILYGPHGGSQEENLVIALKNNLAYAKKLGKKTEESQLQAYQGYGTVYPETEQGYHGFKMSKIFGVPIPKEGLDMNKLNLKGKDIIDIRENVLKKNPALVDLVNKTERIPILFPGLNENYSSEVGRSFNKRGGRLKRKAYGPRPEYMNTMPAHMMSGPSMQTSVGNTGAQMEFGEGGETNLWESDKKAWVDSVNTANLDKEFVRRLYKSVGSIPTPPNMPGYRPGDRSTHSMSDYAGTRRAYPEIVNIGGNLVYKPGDEGYDYADSTGEYITFPTAAQAAWYATNGYKLGTGVLNSINKNGPYNNPKYKLKKADGGTTQETYDTGTPYADYIQNPDYSISAVKPGLSPHPQGITNIADSPCGPGFKIAYDSKGFPVCIPISDIGPGTPPDSEPSLVLSSWDPWNPPTDIYTPYSDQEPLETNESFSTRTPRFRAAAIQPDKKRGLIKSYKRGPSWLSRLFSSNAIKRCVGDECPKFENGGETYFNRGPLLQKDVNIDALKYEADPYIYNSGYITKDRLASNPGFEIGGGKRFGNSFLNPYGEAGVGLLYNQNYTPDIGASAKIGIDPIFKRRVTEYRGEATPNYTTDPGSQNFKRVKRKDFWSFNPNVNAGINFSTQAQNKNVDQSYGAMGDQKFVSIITPYISPSIKANYNFPTNFGTGQIEAYGTAAYSPKNKPQYETGIQGGVGTDDWKFNVSAGVRPDLHMSPTVGASLKYYLDGGEHTPSKRSVYSKRFAKAEGGPVTWSIVEDRPKAGNGLVTAPSKMFDTTMASESTATNKNITSTNFNTPMSEYDYLKSTAAKAPAYSGNLYQTKEKNWRENLLDTWDKVKHFNLSAPSHYSPNENLLTVPFEFVSPAIPMTEAALKLSTTNPAENPLETASNVALLLASPVSKYFGGSEAVKELMTRPADVMSVRSHLGYKKLGGWTGYPDHTMNSSAMDQFDQVRRLTKYDDGGNVEPFVTSDPNDPRIQAYKDSLNLYNSYPSPINKNSYMTRNNSNPIWYDNQIKRFTKKGIKPIAFNIEAVDKANYHTPIYVKPKQEVYLQTHSAEPISPYITSDPEEFAKRKQAYADSLNLYNKTAQEFKTKHSLTNLNSFIPYQNTPENSNFQEGDVNVFKSNTKSGIFDNRAIKPIGFIPLKSAIKNNPLYHAVYQEPVQDVIFKPKPVEYIWTPSGTKMSKTDFENRYGSKVTEREFTPRNKQSKGGSVTWQIID